MRSCAMRRTTSWRSLRAKPARRARREPWRILPRCPPDAARDLPVRHDELLAKQRVFRDELSVTANTISGESRNEPKAIDHLWRLTPSACGWHL